MGNDGAIDCRLCGKRHRMGVTCPDFMVAAPKAKPANKARAIVDKPAKVVDSAPVVVDTPGPGPQPVVDSQRPSKYRDPDKRRAYQRDWIRQKRAQATASAQGAR